LANLLELPDEENIIISDSGKKLSESKVNKGLTPSAILQTPLTFSNSAKTPNSASKTFSNIQPSAHHGINGASAGENGSSYLSPKLSPTSKNEESSQSKWVPKISREAISSAFSEISEIRRLVLLDESDNDGNAANKIPTPPPDETGKNANVTTKSEIAADDDDRKFKKIKIDENNSFFDENDSLLDNDLMWTKDYVWDRFGV
jgi:hypothetical protein